MALEIGTQPGHYEVTALIGEGGNCLSHAEPRPNL